MADRAGEFRRDGYADGVFAAQVNLVDYLEELKEYAARDELGAYAEEIREHQRQFAGDISYEVTDDPRSGGVTERQYEHFEEGFTKGFIDTVQKALRIKRKKRGVGGTGLGSSDREEKAREMERFDVPASRAFSEGDRVTVVPGWKKHWSFTNSPPPTKGLWRKLIGQEGIVEDVDRFGNVWVLDSFAQFTGGSGFPVPARFVRKI